MKLRRVLAEGGTQEVGNADKFRDLRSAAAVGAGAGGLASAGRGQAIGQAGAVDEFVLFDRSMGLRRPSRSRAAGKFRAAALSIIW